MENLATDNPGTATADNLNGPAAGGNGTIATGGQATGAAPAEVDLFKGVDPNKLPPEARAHYDSMLRDYREKTGKLSETIKSETAKAIENYRNKAELYDQIATQEEFVRQWNDYVQKQQASGQPVNEGDPVLTQMKQQIDEMNQKIQLSELNAITDAFANAVNEKGERLNPDFDDLNSIEIGTVQNGREAEPFSLLRACIELAKGGSPQERLANGYKAAKAVRDAIFESGKKAGMGRLQSKIANTSLPPTGATGDTLTVTDKKPKNAREAMAMAKRGVIVSMD